MIGEILSFVSNYYNIKKIISIYHPSYNNNNNNHDNNNNNNNSNNDNDNNNLLLFTSKLYL